MLLWHATNKKNLDSIMSSGLIANNFGVFLADNAQSAAAFVYARGINNIVAFPVESDGLDIIESFDHDPKIFRCRCFISNQDIPNNKIIWEKVLQWRL